MFLKLTIKVVAFFLGHPVYAQFYFNKFAKYYYAWWCIDEYAFTTKQII